MYTSHLAFFDSVDSVCRIGLLVGVECRQGLFSLKQVGNIK